MFRFQLPRENTLSALHNAAELPFDKPLGSVSCLIILLCFQFVYSAWILERRDAFEFFTSSAALCVEAYPLECQHGAVIQIAGKSISGNCTAGSRSL